MPAPSASTSKPLAGLKIVSLAVNLPGPVAAARLRDLGASVTKIEPPDGDPLARGCPPWYQALHENVTVARARSEGSRRARAALRPLWPRADLLLTSSRPAALERLGLGWSELHARFPRLCHVAIIGHVPPDEDQPGHDLTYQASLGLVDPPTCRVRCWPTWEERKRPFRRRFALLLARERARGGQFGVRQSRRSGRPICAAAPIRADAASGLLGGGWPGYNFYQAADGWIAVAALEPHFAERLSASWVSNRSRMKHSAQPLRSRTADEWENVGGSRTTCRSWPFASEVEAVKNERVGWLESIDRFPSARVRSTAWRCTQLEPQFVMQIS